MEWLSEKLLGSLLLTVLFNTVIGMVLQIYGLVLSVCYL